jgi:hypothetical protein
MTRTPILAAAHGVVFLSGFYAAALSSSAVARFIPSTEACCTVINTACFSGGLYAYNVPAADTRVMHTDEAAHLSNLLNFVWCNEYTGHQAPVFTNTGKLGYMEAHLKSIYEAASQPGITSIIYINAPGCLANFMRDDDTLEAREVLEQIRKGYPETSSDVDAYSAALSHSLGYQIALAKYGLPRERQTESGTARGRAVEILRRLRWQAAQLQRVVSWLVEPLRTLCSPVTAIRKSVEEQPARRVCIANGLSPRFPKAAAITTLLETCASSYGSARDVHPFRPSVKREVIWKASGGEKTWTAWANIAAKICKARGITLVYYILPQLNVTEEGYKNVFDPVYVERVRKTFSPYQNVIVIDQSMNRELSPRDTLWVDYQGQRVKEGHLFHVIGKLKLARLMIESLRKIGVIRCEPGCHYADSAWPGERLLPTTPSVIDFVPEGLVFDEIERLEMARRSQPVCSDER